MMFCPLFVTRLLQMNKNGFTDRQTSCIPHFTHAQKTAKRLQLWRFTWHAICRSKRVLHSQSIATAHDRFMASGTVWGGGDRGWSAGTGGWGVGEMSALVSTRQGTVLFRKFDLKYVSSCDFSCSNSCSFANSSFCCPSRNTNVWNRTEQLVTQKLIFPQNANITMHYLH